MLKSTNHNCKPLSAECLVKCKQLMYLILNCLHHYIFYINHERAPVLVQKHIFDWVFPKGVYRLPLIKICLKRTFAGKLLVWLWQNLLRMWPHPPNDNLPGFRRSRSLSFRDYLAENQKWNITIKIIIRIMGITIVFQLESWKPN